MKDIVLPVAGKGRRLRSILGDIHKELAPLPHGYKLIDFAMQEAIHGGVSHIIVVINSEKENLRRYISERYEDFIETTFVYQKKPRGLGDAILTVSEYVSGTFGVILPDEVILSEEPIIYLLYKKSLMTIEDASASILLRRVNEPRRYGIASIIEYRDDLYIVNSIIEKPQEPVSNYAIIGRYVLTECIFKHLSNIRANPYTGEIELSDALDEMAKDSIVIGMELPNNAIRFDCGSPDEYTRLSKYLLNNGKVVSKLWTNL